MQPSARPFASLIAFTMAVLVSAGSAGLAHEARPRPDDEPHAEPGGPYFGFEEVAVEVDGSGSFDPDGRIVLYRWDFGDGTEEVEGPSPTASHVYREEGVYRLDLEVVDNDGEEDEASTVVTITPAGDNGPPTANDDVITTAEDTRASMNLLANDTDPDTGQDLRITEIPDPANHGTVTITGDSTVAYVPNLDYFGPDTFTYKVTDGQFNDTGLVSVSVSPVNDPPDARDDADTTAQSAPVVIDVLANDSDPEGDPLAITAFTNGENGVVTCSPAPSPGGRCTYTPDPDFSGSDSFTYTISDGRGGTDTASVSVTVTPAANRNPDARDDAESTPEGTPRTIEVVRNDTDPDGDPLTVTGITRQPANGTAVANPPRHVTYTPRAGFTGTDAFDYAVSDGRGGSDTATVTVTVTPGGGGANQPPSTRIDSPSANVTIQVGQSVLYRGTATDPDGTIVAHSWSFPGGTPDTSSVEDPGLVTYNAPGTFTTRYNARDDDGADDPSPAERVITVVTTPPPNQPPAARIDTPFGTDTIPAASSVSFTGTGTDPDGTVVAHIWTFPGGTPGSSAAEDPGPVRYDTPGQYEVTYNVRDDDGAVDPNPDRRTIVVTSGGGAGGGDVNVERTAPGSENRIDGHDVIFVLRAIATQDRRADVNGDGRVDGDDVDLVVAALGELR